MVALRTDTPPAIQLPPIVAQGCAPLQVQFPTLNLGNVMYNWNLGMGIPPTSTCPQVTYGTGNYTATLTITTSLGCTASSNGGGQINRVPLSTAAFTASTWATNIDAAVIAFTDQSQGSISSYDWVFGDGGTSTAMSPTYEFNEIGTFDVELFVEDVNGCTATVSHPITIEPVYDVVIQRPSPRTRTARVAAVVLAAAVEATG
ncbi:MAG: PKD domain-containing protein [Flavobacteriales bacterium]